MAASAWADYLDARQRLVHRWLDEGMNAHEAAATFNIDADDVARILRTPADPPVPGSSRDQLVLWRDRCQALEDELQCNRAAPTLPLKVPLLSEVRGLLPHSDPLRCGCQHWTDPPPSGQHHHQCVHGSGVKP